MDANTPKSEYSQQFLDGMVARMGVSYYRYGALKKAYPHKVNAIESLKERLKWYLEGNEAKGIPAGNIEYLMDVANFAMIEFMLPAHPDAHYKGTDSKESPGRRWHDNKSNYRDNEGERPT